MKTNKDNTIYTNTPEYVILEILDYKINHVNNELKELEYIKNSIHTKIKNECDWKEIYDFIKKSKCEYCNNNTEIDLRGSDGIICNGDDKYIYINHFNDAGNIITDIKYCPMCGRKL